MRTGPTWGLMSVLISVLCLVSIRPAPIFALSLDDYFSYSLDVEFSKTEIHGSEVFYATVDGTATCTKNLPIAAIEARITSRVVAEHQVSGARVTLNSGYSVTIESFPSVAGETAHTSEVVSLKFPAVSESGTYNVVGELSEVEVQFVLLGWLDVTSFLPPSQEMGSVTYVADEGGGGGGIIIKPGGSLLDYIDENGVFTADITAESEDGKCWITINEGIIGLAEDGKPLSEISIVEVAELPPLPEDFQASVIGLAYDVELDGATFEPPMTLTLEYDESLIPEAVDEENLVIAMWAEQIDEWFNLDGTVDAENNTITTEIGHLTDFTILAYTRPAVFTASDLSITPAEVDIGEEVTISLIITNTGDLTGSYAVVLKINNIEVETKGVTLSGGNNMMVDFSITPDAEGVYTVAVSGSSGTFEVKTPLEVETPLSATFTAANLNISPAEVNLGESLDISITITNTSNLTGTHKVTLKIDDVLIGTKEVTLAGGDSQIVTFTVAKGTAGIYKVNVAGLFESFAVKEESPPQPLTELINWPVLSGVIAAIVVVALLIFILARRGHTKSSLQRMKLG